MRLSKRIEKIPPYLFVEITRKIAQKRAEGVDVVTLRNSANPGSHPPMTSLVKSS